MGEVATTCVTCGVMGVGGNKGAVAISFSLMRRRVMVVASHFAAHQVGGRLLPCPTPACVRQSLAAPPQRALPQRGAACGGWR